MHLSNLVPKGLRICGVGGKLLSAVKSFYEEASACVKINGETSEHSEIKVGLRQGCVMSMEWKRLINLSTWDQLCVSMVVQERQEKGHCKEGRW